MWNARRRRRQLLIKQGNYCFYCGEPMLIEPSNCRSQRYASFEHLTPRSQGGKSDISNMVLAHRSCNLLRSSKPIEVFVEELFG